MFKQLQGAVPYQQEDVNAYLDRGWWRGMTLGDVLDRASDVHPDREAFVDQTSRCTYGQARERVDRLAVGLMQLGIKPLDRVLIQLPNWNEFIFAYFACQKIGAITVLLIERYRPFEIKRLLKISGATAWIVPKQTQKADFTPVVQDVLRDHPEVKNIITVRGGIARPGFTCLEDLIDENVLNAETRSRLARRRPAALQVAHMGSTGGTTGAPKIVPRTHNSIVCNVEFCSMSWDLHCEDITMISGPVGHDLSFTKGVLGSIITQGKLVFQESRDIADICKTIEREKVTSIVWVPTIAQRLLQYEDVNPSTLSSLKKIHLGGGFAHPELMERLMERFSVCVYSGYGGTEGMTTITRKSDSRETICSTVGKPTLPYDEYKVVGPDGMELPPNKTGELRVKGPGVFSGYYNDQDSNAAIFDADGFFKTGDLAKINEDGYITLAGRCKEMINRGGESISATDIETLIKLHPQVCAAAVVPMPDPVMGERACAYIEVKPLATLTFEDVIKFLKDRKVSVLHLPERIEFVSRIPLTMTDKIDKQALRRDIENKLRAQVDVLSALAPPHAP